MSQTPPMPAFASVAPAETPTDLEVTQDPGPIADWFYEQTGLEWVRNLVANLLEPITESLVIILLAFITVHLLRRLVAKMVDEMKDPDTHQRIGVFRTRVRFGELQEGRQPYGPRRAQRADALGALARSMVGFVIWVLAVFMILSAFGISIGPLVAGAGILGIALGFGAQDLVQDLLSGVFMLAEDQYGVGDIIDVGEASGVVEGVGLRTTRIRDVEGTLWHVPNGEIRRVGNKSQQWARTLLDVSVAYDTDLDRAMGIILEVANAMAADEEHADSFLDAPEMWGVNALGADGIDLRLVIKTKPGDQWAIGREIRRRIKGAFDAAGVEIPFPQRTIWVRSDGSSDVPVLPPQSPSTG